MFLRGHGLNLFNNNNESRPLSGAAFSVSLMFVMGVCKNMSKKITEEVVDRICQMYSDGKSIKEIVLATGVSQPACAYKLKSRKIALRPTPRKYTLNETFFDVIDTEEKAYWLGFISADGCIKNTNSLEITLATKDVNHLEKLRQSLQSNAPIVLTTTTLSNMKSYNGYKLRIYSSRLIQDLSNKLVTKRKSLTLQPYSVRSDLQKDYWRGFIDGDGCIQLHNAKVVSLELMGTLQVVSAFREWANSISEITTKITKMRNVYIQRMGKRQTVYDLLSVLYRNCEFFLDRKKEKAESVLNLIGPAFL